MGQTVLGIWINNAGYGYVTSGRYELLPIPCQNVTMMFYYVEQEPVEDSYWAFNMSYTLDALAQYDPVELLPHSQHIGRLIAVNPSLAKPATVRRWYLGETYDIPCLVSQSIVDMWVADTLNVNDWVIVSFINEIPDTEEVNVAIVVDKVYDSWSL